MASVERENWHLDKRIPIALILTLVIQGGIAVWWAAGADQRIAQAERRLDASDARSEAMRADVTRQSQSVAVLIARMDETNRTLDRLRSDLETTNGLLRQILIERRE